MAPNMLEASTYDVIKEIEGIVGCLPSSSEGLVDAKELDRKRLARVLLYPSERGMDYVMSGPAIPSKMLFQRFVDDLFFGGGTMVEARQCKEFVSYIFQGHGLYTDPAKDLVASDDCDSRTGEVKSGHVLGYLLALERDDLHCAFSGTMPQDKVTKRQALAVLSSLYDPMGLLLELDMQGRFLWHDICKVSKDWADLLDATLTTRLKQWVQEAHRLACDIGTHRFVDLAEKSLIVSTDASIDAWGVDVRANGVYMPIRLMAKGGIFPATQASWSIPRKELVGVHQGLKYIRSVSSHLPVPTILRPLQAPLLYLSPDYEARSMLLLCDSEITIYRLRRVANDKRLPAPERRRLEEIRSMCKELDCVIKHIPSELNFADSITRARLDFGRSIKVEKVLAAIDSSKVVYDHRETMIEENEGDSEEFVGVTALTVDGIDLPSVQGFNEGCAKELEDLMKFVSPDGRYDEGLLSDEGFEEIVAQCVRRCQEVDYELSQFRLYLKGDIAKSQLGLKANILARLGRICYVDADGLLHRRPSSSEDSERRYGKGVLYLGESGYSASVVRILSAIYHYIYGHLGAPKVYGKLTMKYWRKGFKRLVKKTIGSCVSCLKARATKKIDYVATHVQGLITSGLWQVVGADLAGPYGKGSSEDDDVDHYLLLVHDHVSGFTCVRPLRDSRPKTIALGFHSIFCEHGSPEVLLTDNDRVHFVRKDVKVVLAKHGVKYYTLPGYAQFLSFWERPHKDFVEVTKAIRASTRSDDDNSYIADYLMAVRAYNMTPRLWANLPPAELHFTYGVRVPGERGEYSDEVDWDALKMKYIDTDTIKFMRDGLLLLEDAGKDAEVRLYEYLDLWRIRQERNLERMAKNNDRVYSPKLFDIVFTSKSPQHRIGHHLDTIWSGPHTVTGLKGSSVVEVIPGIIFPGLGGVDIDDVDDSRVMVPEQYGKPEVFALKNVVHAAALQGVIYEYLDRGVRVYLDADGTLKEMKLQDGDDDCELVRRARAKTELKRLAKKAEEAEGLGSPQGSLLPPGVEPLDSVEDEDDVQLPPNVNPDVSSEEEPSDSSEEDDTEDRRIVDVPSLRERLGSAEGLRFGKFLRIKPPKDSVVITVGEDYVGMAVVLECEEEDNEDKVLLRPTKVELFDGCITVKKVEDVDLVNAELDSLIYVCPDSRRWTRRRSKEVLQLLEDINARGFGSTI